MVGTSGQATTPFNDRKVSLEALAESEQRSRTLLEALPDAILVHSEDKIVFVNPFCARLLGAAGPEQLLGKDINEIVNPDDLPAIRNRIQDCYASGTASPPMESVLITCDGSSVEIEAVAIPICWNGAPAIEVVARDIRDRKRAERAVQDWQERLVLAQKAGLRIGLWDWDAVANTVIWSDETYRQFGYTRDTFSGRVEDAVTRIHPEDRPRVEDAIRKVIAGGAEYAQQYRLVWPNGTTCWVDAHGVMVSNGSTHMLGIGVDITDLKKTEQSLQESEEKYLLLLNSTAEAIYGLDLEGDCTFCNPACLRLLGYGASKDLLGTNMHELIHHTRADGTPYSKQDCEIYVAVREGRASHLTDEVLWRADRTSFPAEYWSYPMYKTGELVGAVVSFLDISDRKQSEEALRQSEEKYRGLFENATYGIFQSKLDGALLDVNPALVAMLGYSSKEELLTRNLNRDIYEDPADRRSILDSYGPSGRLNGEVNWKRKDGKIIVVRISGGAFRRQDGSYFEVIVEDITGRRSLEAQFRQAQKMEAVGLLAAGISHDYNNLLGVILGNADLLLETTPTGVQQHYTEQIKKATRRAAELTRRLLAFSRKQILHPAILDLNAVVCDVGKILQHLIGEDVQIVTDLETSLDSTRADPGQIEQILMNLATNARDAMPNGGTFTIRTRNAELGPDHVALHPYAKLGRYVRLSVNDTGVGMTDAIRHRVFEPFFTTKAEGRGTGLGLATVYGIVKQSTGYIWFSSAPGAGATFDIYLPRVDEKAPPLVTGVEERSEYPRGTETILLLEDEESLRQVTCECLTTNGYNVLQAGRGNHAIDVAEQYKGPIALIVSDVVLPDMNGPSVATKVRALHPEAKVLYVSGYAGVPVAQQLIAEGAILLQKPLSRGDLLRKVDEVLHRPAVSNNYT
ncbi:MAG: multi-sensor hybrid histidine kinase [Acidobacteriaceae bacterium]|nr:multi-sensor hybrid histidine kinase [Acidobacteriaceae bacterium]